MSAATIAMTHSPEAQETLARQKQMVTVAALVLGGIVVTGVGALVVRRMVRKHRDKKESRKGMDLSEAASWAKRVRQALVNDDWWGTDEVQLRKVLMAIPSWEFYVAVADSYEKQYGRVLANDLEEELQTTEFLEMQQILDRLKIPTEDLEQHVRSWNERLRNAWDLSCWLFPCTDEDAAYAVLKDIKKRRDPRAALLRLEKYYRDQNGISLQDEAEDEMGGDDLAEWNRLRNDILSTRTS